MDALGISNLPGATSTNISALKKALQTQEKMMGDILESTSTDGSLHSRNIAPEVRSIVSEATQKGGELDLSA